MEEKRLTTFDKRYLVLDTYVLASIKNWPTHPERAREIWMATELLSKAYTRCHSIVMDQDGDILEEYKRHIQTNELLRKWFISTSSLANKMITRPRAQIVLGLSIDPDDLKFLEVVVNSPHKILVTNDSDLVSIRDNENIRRLGIRILTVEEALQEL